MRDSKIDIKKTALVIVDLQKGIVNVKGEPYTGKQVVDNATKIAKEFTKKGGFTVLVRVSSLDGCDMLNPTLDFERPKASFPKDWDIVVPELSSLDNTYIITKRQWGAFFGTDLDIQLRRRGIDTIILCGISTSIGVDTTAREAYQNGYNQIFVEDAMAALIKEEHDYVCNYIFPRIGKIRKTEQILEML